MKKLTLLIYLLGSIAISSEIFLLPDDYLNLQNHIHINTKNSKKNILIITSVLNSYTIKKEIEKAIKRDVKIRIISNKIVSDIAKLSKYKNIEIYLLNNVENEKPLKINIFLFDNRYLCVSGLNFDHYTLRSSISLASCSENNNSDIQEVISKLILRSQRYL